MAFDESRGPGPASRARCPHCFGRLNAGGTVSPERRAGEYERERAQRAGYADRTRRYDKEYRHYYGDGEKGFAHGGVAARRARGPETAQAKQGRIEKLIDRIWARNAALEKARK